jgi:hypothetical protein
LILSYMVFATFAVLMEFNVFLVGAPADCWKYLQMPLKCKNILFRVKFNELLEFKKVLFIYFKLSVYKLVGIADFS